MEHLHRILAGVVGQMSLAIVRRVATRGMMLEWCRACRQAADELERRANA